MGGTLWKIRPQRMLMSGDHLSLSFVYREVYSSGIKIAASHSMKWLCLLRWYSTLTLYAVRARHGKDELLGAAQGCRQLRGAWPLLDTKTLATTLHNSRYRCGFYTSVPPNLTGVTLYASVTHSGLSRTLFAQHFLVQSCTEHGSCCCPEGVVISKLNSRKDYLQTLAPSEAVKCPGMVRLLMLVDGEGAEKKVVPVGDFFDGFWF